MADRTHRRNRTTGARSAAVWRTLCFVLCMPSLTLGCLETRWGDNPNENGGARGQTDDNAGSGERSDDDGGWDAACTPGGTPQYLPRTARDYVVMCEPELGVPPQMDCSAGVTIPVTVDGLEVTELLPNFACDNPGLQAGGCVPGNTINRLPGRNRDGTERPEVVWVHFCRSEDGVSKGILADPVWENIFTGAQMIGYNRESGATCFFELNFGSQEQWVGLDENRRAAGVLPNHDEPDFDKAFIPGDQCVACHQNDPFIHNPWIDGARLPSNPEESVLPFLPGDSPYYVVGGSNWDMRSIHIAGNGCLGCHRAPMRIDALYRSLGFDVNEWMPVHDPGSLAEDYAALIDCYENGAENTPGCDWVVPPGGGCEGGVVGADYPHADRGDDGKGGDDEELDLGVDLEPCPDDLTPVSGAPCAGSWQSTLCELQGVTWWCDDGVWMHEDDKDEDGKDDEKDDNGDCAAFCDLQAEADCHGDPDPATCNDICQWMLAEPRCKEAAQAAIRCILGRTEVDLACNDEGESAPADGQCDAEMRAPDTCFAGLE